jgi:membrane dipeptidase
MFIADAHLDLAYNATRGRDVLKPATQQPAIDGETATVGMPDLHAGGVGLVCATVFVEPGSAQNHGYRTPDDARAAGLRQMHWYLEWERQGVFRFIRTSTDVRGIEAHRPGAALPAILLLEGADPIRTPADAEEWVRAGVRIVGLAWRQTRYAGGTGAPGPLTPAGVTLVAELDRLGVIHDASHLAEEAFWQLLDRSKGPVIASHSNCRAIVPTDRQLSDDMARAIFARDGVVGINFYDRFLLSPAEYKTRRATLADVVTHVRRLCDLAGDTRHVGLGTDMDGGLGREQIPEEIRTAADLPRVAEALSTAGFDDAAVAGIMGLNWVRYFATHLPG